MLCMLFASIYFSRHLKLYIKRVSESALAKFQINQHLPKARPSPNRGLGLNDCTAWGGGLRKRSCSMSSGSYPCLLGQHGSHSSSQLHVELSGNMLHNLFPDLPPHSVAYLLIAQRFDVATDLAHFHCNEQSLAVSPLTSPSKN